MKTDNLYITDSSYHLGEELIDILDLKRAGLKTDKKVERSYCLLH